MLMNLLLIGFYIPIIININLTQSNLLQIDPLSISVDPFLHQLCWNSVGDFKEKFIFGLNDKNQEIVFNVFQNLQISKQTYCLKHRVITKRMVINLPFNRHNLKDVLSLTITPTQPLGPQLDVIRFKVVRNGIHFQINPEYGAISTSEIVKCNITMIYKTFETESVKQFSLSSGSNLKVYQSVHHKSTITAYSTCLIPNIIDYSTRFIKYDGYTLYSEYTIDLMPFIPMPLKRFLLVTWKHPKVIPNIYNIAIYEKLQSGEEICIKIFRMKNKLITNSKWKTIVEQCSNKIVIDDLGYYKGNNEHVFAILDMISPLNIYSNYKLSIFWENNQAEMEKNYLYFTPLPNDNNGQINSMFLKPTAFTYEEIRNNISSLDQNFIPVNEIFPVTDSKINLTGYKHFTVLPSISDKNQINHKEIGYSETEKYIQEYFNLEGYSNPFYPFFYILLLGETNGGQIYAEIVQIPFKPNNNFQMFDISLVANNDDQTFSVSWRNTKNTINPGIYGIQITDAQTLLCEAYYIVECSTCNDNYKEISKAYLPKFPDCKSTSNIKETELTTASNYLSFHTNKISDTIIFKARVFAVVFSKLYMSDFSNGGRIKDSSAKKTLFLSLASICIIFVIVVVIIWFVYRHRRAKTINEIRAKVDHSNDSLYDEDVDDPHYTVNDNKTPRDENENAYELI